MVLSKTKALFTACLLGLLTRDTDNLLAQTCPECTVCQAPVCEPTWCEQPYLTGDWWGYRSCMAESGLTYNLNVGQFYYGVASGGVEQQFDYAGHGDYVANADLGKLAGAKGLFLKIRAEHRFGNSIGPAAGTFLAPTIATDLPIPDDETLYLTNVLFTQAFSENFAVFAGKLDTLDGDLNDFAHGRGMTGFSNFSFVSNPIPLRTIPYSTLGTGFVVLDQGQPLWTFTVLNARNTIETDGFSELFAEGVALSTEVRLPTEFLDLPGHQLFGGTWNSRDYPEIGQGPGFLLPNLPIAEVSGSWSLYYNFDQYLVTNQKNPKQGWGIFGRAGMADQDTHPIAYFLSAGIGGNSQLAGRENDKFGVGWFTAINSNQIGPLLTVVTGPLQNSQGVELFYNYEVNPWFHLTPDLQVLVPGRENIDTALLVGLRGVLTF